eukprot:GHVQ01015716.1.p1 GENE.GHVQ01015716.1~~GHVQ01015716.1.p1  ORF type:complete len:1694 (+),score=98.89 GHVQ01015716.1:151-5232(+)
MQFLFGRRHAAKEVSSELSVCHITHPSTPSQGDSIPVRLSGSYGKRDSHRTYLDATTPHTCTAITDASNTGDHDAVPHSQALGAAQSLRRLQSHHGESFGPIALAENPSRSVEDGSDRWRQTTIESRPSVEAQVPVGGFDKRVSFTASVSTVPSNYSFANIAEQYMTVGASSSIIKGLLQTCPVLDCADSSNESVMEQLQRWVDNTSLRPEILDTLSGTASQLKDSSFLKESVTSFFVESEIRPRLCESTSWEQLNTKGDFLSTVFGGPPPLYLATLKVFECFALYRQDGTISVADCLNCPEASSNSESALLGFLVFPKYMCLVSYYPLIGSFKEILGALYMSVKSLTSQRYTGPFATEESRNASEISDTSVQSMSASQLFTELVSYVLDDMRVPLQGKHRSVFQIGFSRITLLGSWVKPMSLFQNFDFSLEPLFSVLSSMTIARALEVILLEGKLLLLSRTAQSLTDIYLGLLCLIRPYRWHHTFIPLVPYDRLELLGSVTPFLCGCHAEVSDLHTVAKEMAEDTIIIDVDTNQEYSPFSLPNSATTILPALRLPDFFVKAIEEVREKLQCTNLLDNIQPQRSVDSHARAALLLCFVALLSDRVAVLNPEATSRQASNESLTHISLANMRASSVEFADVFCRTNCWENFVEDLVAVEESQAAADFRELCFEYLISLSGCTSVDCLEAWMYETACSKFEDGVDTGKTIIYACVPGMDQLHGALRNKEHCVLPGVPNLISITESSCKALQPTSFGSPSESVKLRSVHRAGIFNLLHDCFCCHRWQLGNGTLFWHLIQHITWTGSDLCAGEIGTTYYSRSKQCNFLKREAAEGMYCALDTDHVLKRPWVMGKSEPGRSDRTVHGSVSEGVNSSVSLINPDESTYESSGDVSCMTCCAVTSRFAGLKGYCGDCGCQFSVWYVLSQPSTTTVTPKCPGCCRLLQPGYLKFVLRNNRNRLKTVDVMSFVDCVTETLNYSTPTHRPQSDKQLMVRDPKLYWNLLFFLDVHMWFSTKGLGKSTVTRTCSALDLCLDFLSHCQAQLCAGSFLLFRWPTNPRRSPPAEDLVTSRLKRQSRWQLVPRDSYCQQRKQRFHSCHQITHRPRISGGMGEWTLSTTRSEPPVIWDSKTIRGTGSNKNVSMVSKTRPPSAPHDKCKALGACHKPSPILRSSSLPLACEYAARQIARQPAKLLRAKSAPNNYCYSLHHLIGSSKDPRNLNQPPQRHVACAPQPGATLTFLGKKSVVPSNGSPIQDIQITLIKPKPANLSEASRREGLAQDLTGQGMRISQRGSAVASHVSAQASEEITWNIRNITRRKKKLCYRRTFPNEKQHQPSYVGQNTSTSQGTPRKRPKECDSNEQRRRRQNVGSGLQSLSWQCPTHAWTPIVATDPIQCALRHRHSRSLARRLTELSNMSQSTDPSCGAAISQKSTALRRFSVNVEDARPPSHACRREQPARVVMSQEAVADDSQQTTEASRTNQVLATTVRDVSANQEDTSVSTLTDSQLLLDNRMKSAWYEKAVPGMIGLQASTLHDIKATANAALDSPSYSATPPEGSAPVSTDTCELASNEKDVRGLDTGTHCAGNSCCDLDANAVGMSDNSLILNGIHHGTISVSTVQPDTNLKSPIQPTEIKLSSSFDGDSLEETGTGPGHCPTTSMCAPQTESHQPHQLSILLHICVVAIILNCLANIYMVFRSTH